MKSLRLYHFVLALCAIGAWITAEEFGLAHAWFGYAVAAVLIVRLLLGMMRRRGFAFTRLLPTLAPAPVGQGGIRHPIISRLLVLAILLSVAGTATTGIMMDRGGTLVGKSIRADDGGRGDIREERENNDEALRGDATLFGLITPARADEGGEDREEDGGIVGEVHETLGNLILPLVALHAFYLLLFRFPLARFMLFAERLRA